MKTDVLLKILKIQDYIFSLREKSAIKEYLSNELSYLPGIKNVYFSENEVLQNIDNSPVITYPIISNNVSYGFLLITINNLTSFKIYEQYIKNLIKVIGFVFHENTQKVTQKLRSYHSSFDLSKSSNLLELQEKFTDLLKNVKLFFVMLDSTGRITYCNNYFLCQTGYTKEELTGKDWFEVFEDKLQVDHEKKVFNSLMNDEERIINIEKIILTKDCDKLWVSWNNSTFFDNEKNVVGLICFGENISQRRIAEEGLMKKSEAYIELNKEYLTLNEELKEALNNQKHIIEQLEISKAKAEESDKLKTAFLQNMSHEIRTPMNAIMGFSELLVHYHNDKEKLEKFSQIINQRCDDLLDIINDVLDIAKIESGQQNLKLEECNLEELFMELKIFFNEFQRKINKENIQLYIIDSCPTEGCIIVTDKVKLKQILINLINNAYKFTNQGSISVGCTLRGNDLHFYVSDTGIGIPPDKQKFIFERFTQVQFEIKNGGTGLGLSIVKGLVNILGGNIQLESEINKGSTFSFTIPYVKSKHQNKDKNLSTYLDVI